MALAGTHLTPWEPLSSRGISRRWGSLTDVSCAALRAGTQALAVSACPPRWSPVGRRRESSRRPEAEAGSRCVRVTGASAQQQRRQWGVLGSSAAVTLWDFDSWERRRAPVRSSWRAVIRRARAAVRRVERPGHDRHVERVTSTPRLRWERGGDEALKQATGVHIAPYGSMLLARADEGLDRRRVGARRRHPGRLGGTRRGGSRRTLPLDERDPAQRGRSLRRRARPPPNTSIDDAPALPHLDLDARRAASRRPSGAGRPTWPTTRHRSSPPRTRATLIGRSARSPVGGAPGRGARSRVAPSRGG